MYGWNDCPESVRSLVDGIVKKYREILGDNLTGVYLHGSLALGCFNPAPSDIDFLAVVKRNLTLGEKKEIIDYLLGQQDAPPKGVEMSIVLEESVRDFAYPTPFELHYSEGWRERYEKDVVDLAEQRYDEDLAAHFTMVEKRGIRLYGRPIAEMFPGVPEEFYIRSLLYDAKDIFRIAVEENPVYAMLNLCRIMAYLEDKIVVSKKEGAEWGLSHLPPEFSPLIAWALDTYSGKSGQSPPDSKALAEFISYAGRKLPSGTSAS